MSVITVKQLLEAGVHFGHYTNRWDPRMKPYIFTARNGIYIIDLQKTEELINEAYQAMTKIVREGGKVLFVGTKKQAQDAVKEIATKTGQYYVDNRWLGGTLTNFKTIRSRIKYLEEIDKLFKTGEIKSYPKKEIQEKMHEKEKLESYLLGIKDMIEIPQAIFVVDPRKEDNAVKEAKKLGIPVFGICDTNANPQVLDYVIPANDDAIRAVRLIIQVLGNAIIEGQGGTVEPIVFETSDEPVVEKIERRRPEFNRTIKADFTRKNFDESKTTKKEEKVAAEKKSTTKKAEPKEEAKPVAEKPAKKVATKETKTTAKKEEKVVAEKKTTTKKAETKEAKPVAEKPAKKAATKETKTTAKKEEKVVAEKKTTTKKAEPKEVKPVAEKPTKKAATKETKAVAEKPAKKTTTKK